MELTVKQRLISFLAYKKIGQKRFALECGLSAGFVNSIVRSIQPDTLHKISMQYPELNTGWLLTGEGEMLKQNSNNNIMQEGINYKEKYYELLEKNNQLQSELLEIKSKMLESKEGGNNVRDGVVNAKAG